MGTLTVDNLNVNSTASITSGAGIVLQQITVAVAKATFTSAIPDDDTTPTISEGTEIYSQAITPSATSSKVLVIMSQTLQYARDSGEQTGYYNIMRDSTEILDATYNGSGGGSGANFGPVTISSIIMDSPSSTSALTYKTQIRCETTSNSGSVRANQQTSGSETPSSIQLVEIGA